MRYWPHPLGSGPPTPTVRNLPLALVCVVAVQWLGGEVSVPLTVALTVWVAWVVGKVWP